MFNLILSYLDDGLDRICTLLCDIGDIGNQWYEEDEDLWLD